MEHVSTDVITSFLAGVLTPSDSAEFEEHLDLCNDCREVVSEVVRHRGALASTHKQRVPAGPARSRLLVSTGDVIDGRYRIERVLGMGGMGCVFQAHHIHLNQKVALKAMLPKAAADDSAVMRFLREARAASRLETAYVCRVLDVGLLPAGTPYLAMELLVGESLDARLQREGPLPFSLAVRWTLQICEALSEAHAKGIVHRDLKPSNLFVTRSSHGGESLKVLDFGIAKSVHPDIEAGLKQTTLDMVVGTPQYMAPEQLRSGVLIDGRTDLWAVGCVLHEMLTGSAPFQALSVTEMMLAISQKKPARLLPTVAVPRGFQSVIDRCLAKDAKERFSSADALRETLRKYLEVVPSKRTKPRSVKRWVGSLVLAAGLLVAGWMYRTTSRPVPQVVTPSIAPAPTQMATPVQEPPPTPSAPPVVQVPLKKTVETKVPKKTPPAQPKAPSLEDSILEQRH